MSAADKGRLNNNHITASNFGEASGYVKYSNGLNIVWGCEPCTFASGQERLTTFPNNFSFISNNYIAVATINGTQENFVKIFNKQRNGMYISAGGYGRRVDYVCIGLS